METPQMPQETPGLRFLRIMVTVLTLTMIAGIVTVVAIIFVRVPTVISSKPTVTVPEELVLPEGARALAFTQGTDWYAVVTTDDRILIFDRDGGTLRQTVQISTE